MNSKKAITLLVLATLIMSMVPLGIVNAITVNLAGTPEVGETIVVTGLNGDIPAGYPIEVYWDDASKAWNGVEGLLNSSTALSSGNYEIWFDVPEATIGDHYVWIKNPTTGEVDSAVLTVTSSLEIDTSSGLEDEDVYVDIYGFDAEDDYKLYFLDDAAGPDWTDVAVPGEAIGALGSTDYEGTLANFPVLPGSVEFDDGGALEVDEENLAGDPVDGTLYLDGTNTVAGSIDYLTGEYEITLAVAAAGAVTCDYSEINDVALKSSTTDSLGTKENVKTTVPTGAAAGVHHITALSSKGASASAAFTVGAVIELSVDAGDVGDLVRIRGRGFNPDDYVAPGGGANEDSDIATIEIRDDAGAALATPLFAVVVDGDTSIDDEGKFDVQIVIPSPGDEDDYTIHVTDDGESGNEAVKTAWADFEIENEASISLSPEYGPQGSKVTVSGENFPNINGEVIMVQFRIPGGAAVTPDPVEELETKSDGSFTGEFRVPTQVDGVYTCRVYAEDDAAVAWNIVVDEEFRIGTMLVLLSDDEGVAGEEITLTGSGFTAADFWNATFGGDDLITTDATTAAGLLEENAGTPQFYVPQVDPGMYDIVVLDIDSEITVTVPFEVTATTAVEVDPVTLPSGYNMSITGTSWADDAAGTFDIVVYNSTDDWDIDAAVMQGAGGGAAALTATADGDFEAWWLAVQTNGDDFENGVYTMNITDSNDYFLQATFTIGDEHVSASPRKATFRIGDIVSFNLQHSFGDVAPVTAGDLRIYDPAGNLYWDGDPLNTWTRVGMYYTAPASSQVANGNPMLLLDDAPLGTWTYEWREAGANPDNVKEGTFVVEAAAEEVINEAVADLNDQIMDLTDQLSGVTEDFDDVKSDISGVLSVAEQAVAAANAATEAVNAVATQANNAGAAAEAAQVAAENAAEAASGLTTLVYGAIGAALVAALAAIVSLMQISRRIAG